MKRVHIFFISLTLILMSLTMLLLAGIMFILDWAGTNLKKYGDVLIWQRVNLRVELREQRHSNS